MQSAPLKGLFVGLAVVAAAPLALAADASYSFTSGPYFDNINWPRSQLAKRTATGLSGDPFFTPEEVGFNNFTGNLTFFDANNLTTRPANLINGAAWWTDVKTRTFVANSGQTVEVTTLAVDFLNAPGGFVDAFGFDFAVAAIGGGGAPASISVVAYDNLGYTSSHSLSLTSSANPFTQLFGSYTSMSVPNSGREARFWFSDSSLLTNPEAFEDSRYNPSTYGIKALNLNLGALATLGGTTQVAIDNFILGAGEQPTPITEPLPYFNPIPIGENTPYTFVYADVAAGSNETVIKPNSHTSNDVLQAHIAVNSATDVLNNLSARSVTMSTDIYTPASSTGGLQANEVTHVLQGGGTTIEVDVQGNGSPVVQGISTTTALTTSEPESITKLQQMIEQQMEVVDTVSDLYGTYTELYLTAVSEMRYFLPTGASDATGDPDYFFNFSFEDYMAYRESLEEEWVIGDAGAIARPLLGPDGQILSYAITSWVVTDSVGTLRVTVSAVPEPASAMTLAAAGALLLRTRRRRG